MKPGTTAKSIKICSSVVSGPNKVNTDTLKALGMIKLKVSFMSDLMIGKNTDITLYDGTNFDGGSKLLKSTPTAKSFDKMFFSDGKKMNDNIFSFIFNSYTLTTNAC